MHEPDWAAFADMQFLLYNRIADSLNAALSSIALSGMPEAHEQTPEFWRSRASAKIANVVNLFTAWSYLARFKLGEAIPERALRPFPINQLLSWLGVQLQISPPPSVEDNPLLQANLETLQEAVWLLYSVAFTQGSRVQLELETNKLGTWFRIRFYRLAPFPSTLEELLASFGTHWRARDTAFELATARDFIKLNGSDLAVASGDGYGELAFFVRATGTGRTRPLSPEVLTQTTTQAATQPSQPTSPASINALLVRVTPLPGGATPVFPEAQIVPEPEPKAPTLEILRPLPPASRLTPPPIHKTGPLAPAEGAAPPVEPKEAAPDITESKTPADQPAEPVVHLIPEDTPTVPGTPIHPTPEPPAPGTVIVPVKIPAPEPPRRLVTPPASTAVVRQTQTAPSVKPDSGADKTVQAPSAPAAPPETPKDAEASTPDSTQEEV